jgi:hypothetical protein
LMVFWRGRFVGMARAADSNQPISLPAAPNSESGQGVLVLIDDAFPLPRWNTKRSASTGDGERADAAWLDVIIHTKQGPLTFIVSPSATA